MKQNKMTPTPWELLPNLQIMGHQRWYEIQSKAGIEIAIIYPEHHERTVAKKNAEAIVSAVNNTYGAGINPEAVPDMLKSLNAILNVHYGWTEKYQLKMVKEWAKAAIEKTIKATYHPVGQSFYTSDHVKDILVHFVGDINFDDFTGEDWESKTIAWFDGHY